MQVNITIPKGLTNIAASWKTTLLGLAALVKAGMVASGQPDFSAALHNPQFQIFVVLGAIGLIAKDAGVSGKASDPPDDARVVLPGN